MNRRESLAALGAGAMSFPGAKTNSLTAMPAYKETGARLVRASTPTADGFRYPAEWEKHEATIMVLPPPRNWKASGITQQQLHRQWAAVANRLNEFEPVKMVVRRQDKRAAKRILSRTIELVEFPVNDGWSRDSGPMILVNRKGKRRIAGFTFNGWGGKFPPYKDDALLKARLAKHLGMPMYPIDLVLEGGAVAVDGEGTLLTTEQCLLHKNRNSKSKRAAVEKVLNSSLGTRKVIWLGKGLEPDRVTDGHIDGLAAFAAPGVVLLHTTNDRNDRNYRICQDAKRRLQRSRDAKGRRIKIIEVPLTSDISSMNFYIANDAVLVPTTGVRRDDQRPLAVLRAAFPKRKIVPIVSNVLGDGGGGIHCITQQIPKVQSPKD